MKDGFSKKQSYKGDDRYLPSCSTLYTVLVLKQVDSMLPHET